MAEAAGLAVGVVALTGLFTTCTQCLDLIQLGKAYASDYELLQTKFEAQKLRFLILGGSFWLHVALRVRQETRPSYGAAHSYADIE
jgi:hypothetical protein